jgi:mono/diheme cytochrome c family protein
MNVMTPILALAGFLAATTALAQENPPPAEMREGEPASEFRTFDPTQAEWENFRSAGKIPHEGGEAVYNALCAGCHMPDGQGAVGAGAYPALADNELLAAPSYPINLVIYGQGAMPPFGGLLDDGQVADVVNYVRSHFGNDFVSGEFGEARPEEVAETRQ